LRRLVRAEIQPAADRVGHAALAQSEPIGIGIHVFGQSINIEPDLSPHRASR
jgi:hypothetical protein